MARIDPPEAGTADVGEPRTEAVAEQAEETEHHIRVGPGVGHGSWGYAVWRDRPRGIRPVGAWTVYSSIDVYFCFMRVIALVLDYAEN